MRPKVHSDRRIAPKNPTGADNFKNLAKKPKLLFHRRALLPKSLFVSKKLQNLSVSYVHNFLSILKNTNFFLGRMSFTTQRRIFGMRLPCGDVARLVYNIQL
jgi:hypothetical protein